MPHTSYLKIQSQKIVFFLLFFVSIKSFSQNDNCGASATLLTPNSTCSYIAGSTAAGFTDSNQGCVTGNEDDDGWFKFVATATTHTVTLAGGGGFDYVLGVYNSCGGTQPTGGTCVDATGSGGTETRSLSGLTIGSTYYISAHEYYAGGGTFSICVTSPAAPPANDNCSGATAFPAVPTDGTCSNLNNQTTNGATNSSVTPTGACTSNSGTPDDDVWFSFVATATNISLAATYVSGNTDVYWQVYSSACSGTMTSILCTDTDAGGTLSGLTISNTYYIRLYTYSGSGSTTQNICLSSIPDPCSSITNIASCGSTVSTTITAGTGSYGTSSCGFTTSGREKIFTYTPPSTGYYNIQQASSFAYIDYQYKAVSAGCSSTGWTCIDDLNGAATASPSFSLTAGVQYYILLDPESTAGGAVTFSVVCAPTPPSNDDCNGATTLTVNSGTTCTTSTGGTLLGATTSTQTNICTVGIADDDVWYKFTATATSHSVSLTNIAGSTTDLYHSVYGGTCGSIGAPLSCSDPNISLIGGLTIGNVYYVRIYSSTATGGQNTTFSVCVLTPPPPPSNDEPTGAITITVGASCSYTTVTNANATSSTCGTIPAPGCSSYLGADVWFKVTVPASGAITFDSQTGVITDGGMAVYSGTPCGVMTLLGCDDDASANGLMPSLTVGGQTPGTTLYIRFWEYGGDNNGTFGLCATSFTPVANDECTGAYTVAVNSSTTCTSQTGGTLINATGSTQANICAGGSDDDDVWYSFVATATTHSISLNNVAGSTTDLYHSVYTGSCGSMSDAFICSDPNTSLVGGLTIGTTYFIRVYSYSSTGGQTTTFSVCVTTPTVAAPPANNNCSGAISVTTNTGTSCTSLAGGTLVGATSSTIANTCGGTADDDVWYSFVATSTSHSVSLTNVAGSTTDLYHSVYGGTCGSVGVALVCSDPNSSSIYGLTIGNTYFIRVFSYTSTFGQTTTFSVCVTTLPPTGPCGNPTNNDYCSNPATLTQGVGTFSSTTSSLYSADQSSPLSGIFCGSIENNSWYYFVAAATTESFPITAVSGCAGASGIQAQVFSVTQSTLGCCTSFTSMSNCFNPGTVSTGTVTATGLTIGQTYILMVDGYGGDVCNFTFSNWTATGILPLELITFVAKNEGSKNKIEWVTATERNTDRFSLEKSKDGVDFEKLIDIKAAGNSTAPKNYNAFDINPYEEITYYRLKQFDLDGVFEYSNIIAVDNKNLIEKISNVHPNPTNSFVNFDLFTKTKGDILTQIINYTGDIVLERTETIEQGNTSLTISMNDFATGVYLLKVTIEKTGKVLVYKIIKN